MKKIVAMAVLLFAVTAVRAEPPKAPANPLAGGPSSDLVQDATIRKLYAKFTEAWNRHDAKAMASFWTIDGDAMEPDGSHAKGKTEVEKLFTQEQTTVFKDTHLTLTIDTSWFINADVALIDGTYELTGVRDQQGNEIPIRKGHLTSVLVGENGNWQVAASRATVPVPLPYKK